MSTGPEARRGIGAAASVAVLAVQVWRRGDETIRTGLYYFLIWPALTTAPLVVSYLSFRHLYVATVGFAVGAIALLARQIPSSRWFALASAGEIALYGMQLAVETPRYREALTQSREIREAVNGLAQVAAAGDVVVLDVPRRYREIWVWAWASPFALRPPFVAQDPTSKLVVIERPSVFRSQLSDEELDSLQSGDVLAGPASFDSVMDSLAQPQ